MNPKKTASFKAPPSLPPASIEKAFGPFGSVNRILEETKNTHVCWEKKITTDPTYPEVAVEINNNLPVEIAVIGSFAPGEGERFYRRSVALQASHATFVDEYNEASAKIANADFSKNDPTTVYTFSVDMKDLVFHRHEGHRAITGITSSAGATLRFSGATPEEAAESPEIFLEKMFIVEIPSDSMFVLRFHGTVYHQFAPRDPAHPAFFAISVHTNEAGGLKGDLLRIVQEGNASIPLLTEPISDDVAEMLEKKTIKKVKVKENKRRTVSATKRYMLRLRQDKDADKKNNLGNHITAPEPISDPIADLLATSDWKTRIPVFSLPRLATIYHPPQNTYFVEYDEEAPLPSTVEVEGAGAVSVTLVEGVPL